MKLVNFFGLIITLLLSCWSHSASASESSLQWGTAFDTVSPSNNVKKYQNRILEVTKPFLGKTIPAEEQIVAEGKLPTDPGVAESKEVTSQIPMVLKLALCARIAKDHSVQASCQKTATQGLLEWAKVYQPTGNPINENQLIPLIQAWDALKPMLTAEDQKSLQNFGHRLIDAGDAFYAHLKPTDGRYYNNWGTWRLCIRSLTAAVLEDQNEIRSSQQKFAEHMAHNLLADGSSSDFLQRDALLYHVYDLVAYVDTAAQMPAGFFTAEELSHIQKSLDFIRPFFTGEKQHIEFANSKVPFDIKRKNAQLEDYQNAPWKPEHARPLLRLARVVFPSVKQWTQNIVDEKYDPILKLQTAGLGD
jgi:hypothetical protein